MTKKASAKSSGESLQETAAKHKGLPPDISHKVQVDPTNPGRHVLMSKAAQRAQVARETLKGLTKSTLRDLADQELSEMTKDLGLRLRGTGAKGDVTREDYLAALTGLLPTPVKGQA